jgi:membrane-associated phospholipid phosphatase
MKQINYQAALMPLACFLALSPAISGRVHAANMIGSIVTFTADPIENAGNVLLIALPATAVGFSLYNRDINGLLEYGASALLTDAVTVSLKNGVHELRPNRSDYLSFPSGHSSTTFAAAEFIRKRYGWEFGVAAYALASFTAYSRIESKEHYFHDVAAGAAIGVSSSYLFTRPFHRFQIQPTTDGKHFGVTISKTF